MLARAFLIDLGSLAVAQAPVGLALLCALAIFADGVSAISLCFPDNDGRRFQEEVRLVGRVGLGARSNAGQGILQTVYRNTSK